MASLNSIGGLHYEMIKRCYNENSVAYKDYGAKGIKVCEEWHDRTNFKKWCIENNYRKGMRLERIDTSKNYQPNNCKLGTTFVKDTNSISQKSKTLRKHRLEMIKLSGISDNYCNSRLYSVYQSMHTRCENTNHKNYNNYGGRGIKVCDIWSGKDGFFYFYKWSMDNGYSDKLTIDRIDNNKGYSPANCRWVSQKEQTNNRRCSLNFEYNGKTCNLAEICKMENIKYGLLYLRLKKGMSLQHAILDVKEKYN